MIFCGFFIVCFVLVNGRNRSSKTSGGMVSEVSEVDAGDEENGNLNLNSNSNSNTTRKVARKGKYQVSLFVNVYLFVVGD